MRHNNFHHASSDVLCGPQAKRLLEAVSAKDKKGLLVR